MHVAPNRPMLFGCDCDFIQDQPVLLGFDFNFIQEDRIPNLRREVRFLKVEESYDLSRLEAVLKRRDYGAILVDPDLFWLAFCKAASQCKNSHCFSMKVTGGILTISGHKDYLQYAKRQILYIQDLFQKNRESQKEFSFIEIHTGLFSYLHEASENGRYTIVDSFDLGGAVDGRVDHKLFGAHIRPAIAELATMVNAACSESRAESMFDISGESAVMKHRLFKITWCKECIPYPIAKKEIALRSFEKMAHEKYQRQLHCDIKLIAHDGEIALHSVPLYLHGGEVLQKMLTAPMKESKQKELHFTQYSVDTLKAFCDYIYLGEEGLHPELFLQGRADLFELMDFAHVYQIQGLIDCSANLASLLCNEDENEKIKELAVKYNNPHLRKIYDLYGL